MENILRSLGRDEQLFERKWVMVPASHHHERSPKQLSGTWELLLSETKSMPMYLYQMLIKSTRKLCVACNNKSRCITDCVYVAEKLTSCEYNIMYEWPRYESECMLRYVGNAAHHNMSLCMEYSCPISDYSQNTSTISTILRKRGKRFLTWSFFSYPCLYGKVILSAEQYDIDTRLFRKIDE